MSRPDGGLLGVAAGPTPLSAKGAWNLRDVYQSRRQAAWPITSIADPFYARTSLLLSCEGSNNSTTFTDSSPNAFTVTVVGTTKITTAQSKFGSSSASFDSTSNYLRLGGQSAFAFYDQDFVVELWVRPTTISSVNQIFDFRMSGDASGNFLTTGVPRINLALVDGKVVWYVLNAIRIQGTTVLATNTWHHIAVARSGTSTRLYVNGTQEGSTWTDTTVYTVGTNRPLIGNNGETQAAAQNFIGQMDDIRMTKGSNRGYTGSTITVPAVAFPAIG